MDLRLCRRCCLELHHQLEVRNQADKDVKREAKAVIEQAEAMFDHAFETNNKLNVLNHKKYKNI